MQDRKVETSYAYSAQRPVRRKHTELRDNFTGWGQRGKQGLIMWPREGSGLAPSKSAKARDSSRPPS